MVIVLGSFSFHVNGPLIDVAFGVVDIDVADAS